MFQRLTIEKAIRWLSLITLVVFVLYGFLITFFPLFPFWIDEWLLIENLKFKPAEKLWFHLDRLQQFPRVYLQLIKQFSARCDYSYTSLRLPSFLTHCAGLLLLFRLSGRIFRNDNLSRFTWVMIYVSFSTSIHYFVQLKQYTMEMALSLVGIWQLLELIKNETDFSSKKKRVSLWLSFAICPFFSYTYPIVVAPVYLITFVRSFKSKRWKISTWIPLCIGILSISIFYLIDVRHVMADQGMQDFWKDLLMKTFSLKVFFRNTYMMFCNLGAGDLFGNIMGVLGVVSFLFACYQTFRFRLSTNKETDLLLQYSCLLLITVFALFIAGKLPLGTFRLNAFVVPAAGLMIVRLLQTVKEIHRLRIPATTITAIIFLAAIGNIYVTMAELGGEEHAKKLRIYQTSERVIEIAQKEKLPVFVTSMIAFPFEDRWEGDWILKTLPAYKVSDPLPVYPLSDPQRAEQHIRRSLPAARTSVVLDGDSFRIVRLATVY